MILFQLNCSNNHQFEAWFRDGDTYDEQQAAGVIECPHCNDTHVSKAPMAPHLGTAKNFKKTPEARAKEVAEQILTAVNKLRDDVEESCEDVGDEFAEEVRRIHYGETDDRGIFGEATEEETSELDEEGIEYHRLPTTPRRDS